jgi:kynurenine formamidase
MAKVIDLTLPIRKHWRYPLRTELAESRAKGDCWQVTQVQLKTHWYTHIDARRHIIDEGKTLDQYSLDPLVGEAVILNLSFIGANQAVTWDMLEGASQGLKKRDLIILRTDWNLKSDWDSKAFWADSPYMDVSAAEWLKSYRPQVIGFDFPQDYCIRYSTGAKATAGVPEKELHYQPCHDILLLEQDIRMIENMTNLSQAPCPYCHIAALPLNLVEADGAPIRVVAFVE